MGLLYCRFASAHSSPERIQRWIKYLEQLVERYQHDREAVDQCEHLLRRAHQWAESAERERGSVQAAEAAMVG